VVSPEEQKLDAGVHPLFFSHARDITDEVLCYLFFILMSMKAASI